MSYDNWKLQTPPENKTKECEYCGEESEKEFCSKACEKAYMSDN